MAQSIIDKNDKGKSMADALREKAENEARIRREEDELRANAIKYAESNGLNTRYSTNEVAVGLAVDNDETLGLLVKFTAEWQADIDIIQKEKDMIHETIKTSGKRLADVKEEYQKTTKELNKRQQDRTDLLRSTKLGAQKDLVIKRYDMMIAKIGKVAEEKKIEIDRLEALIEQQNNAIKENEVKRKAYGISYAKANGARDKLDRAMKKAKKNGSVVPVGNANAAVANPVARAAMLEPYEAELIDFCKENSDYLKPENYPVEERSLLMLNFLNEAQWQEEDPEKFLKDILVNGLRRQDPKILTDKPRAKLRDILGEDVMELFKRVKAEAEKKAREAAEREAAEKAAKQQESGASSTATARAEAGGSGHSDAKYEEITREKEAAKKEATELKVLKEAAERDAEIAKEALKKLEQDSLSKPSSPGIDLARAKEERNKRYK